MGQASSASSSLKADIAFLQDRLSLLNKAAFFTHDDLVRSIEELNEITRSFTDRAGKQLCFSIKKGTDTSVLWKPTVRIRCLKINTVNNNIESSRLLKLRQFIVMHKEIVDQINAFSGLSEVVRTMTARRRQAADPSTDSLVSKPSTSNGDQAQSGGNVNSSPSKVNKGFDPSCDDVNPVPPVDDLDSLPDSDDEPMPPITRGEEFLASAFFSSEDKIDEETMKDLNECCVCMDEMACIMLSCGHEFCETCIDNWTRDISHSNCPLCRSRVKGNDDTWVLTDKCASDDYAEEVKGYLVGLADR